MAEFSPWRTSSTQRSRREILPSHGPDASLLPVVQTLLPPGTLRALLRDEVIVETSFLVTSVYAYPAMNLKTPVPRRCAQHVDNDNSGYHVDGRNLLLLEIPSGTAVRGDPSLPVQDKNLQNITTEQRKRNRRPNRTKFGALPYSSCKE